MAESITYTKLHVQTLRLNMPAYVASTDSSNKSMASIHTQTTRERGLVDRW